ncbi:MAG: metallophosphoesterase [Clostridium sp.]|nr:metallophosphoesterase [Clostridium sp.]
MKKHRRKTTGRLSALLSLLLVATMAQPLFQTRAAENDVTMDGNVTWSYLDDGSDPAGDSIAAGYDRTSWTKDDYDISAWKTATGPFGAKKGKINDLGGGCTPKTLLTQYKADGTTDIEAFFFRTDVTIPDASKVTKISGSVIYDDAATVYVNGVKIAGFDDDSITGNLQYGGSNAGDPKTGTISTSDPAALAAVKDGKNVIAVELHQGRSSSSDIYFDMPTLTFETTVSVPVYTQKNISWTVGKDASEINVTWYADVDGTGTLLVAKNSEVSGNEMPADAKSFTANGTASNKSGYYNYQTTATGLSADTTYAYQLVNGETKSEIRSFTTGGTGAFSFAAAGDPQIGASGSSVNDTDGWEKTLKLISGNSAFDGVDFLLSAGDQVNTASNEDQYDGYLEHDTLLDLPTATVVGNHDSGSAAYDQHFNNPNESSYGTTAAGGDYYFVYNHVLFLALNSNNTSTAEHKAFMEQAMQATAGQDITWKVVVFHHSIYSVASHSLESGILTRREELVPVFKDLDIDVVLMGHDHVYCRTYMMDGLDPMTDASIYNDADYSSITNPTGILYVTLNSASENVPNISRVDVSDSQFKVTTYRTSDMSVVDSFAINKKHVHNMKAVSAREATCLDEGNIAYWYCDECGKYFRDADGEQEITLLDTVVAAKGHQYGAWQVVTAATTSATGIKKHECTVCGKVETAAIPVIQETTTENVTTEEETTEKVTTEDATTETTQKATTEDTGSDSDEDTTEKHTGEMEDTESTISSETTKDTGTTEDKTGKDSKLVKTGDTTPIVYIAVLASCACFVGAGCVFAKSRKNKQ